MYAYYDGTTWRGEASSTAPDNVSTLVGLPGLGTGYQMSLALDSRGYPHIAFATSPANTTDRYRIRYASWDGARWTVETIEEGPTYGASPGGWTGMFPSLAIDSTDTPHLSYIDCQKAQDSRSCYYVSGGTVYDGNGTLMYATKAGSTWTTAAVDPAGTDVSIDGKTSLALDSAGRPHIAYFDRNGSQLKYTTLGATGWTTPEVVATPSYGGLSMALHNDLPRIAYISGNSLRYASWNGTAWVYTTLIPSGLDNGVAGAIPALGVDNDDVAHIAYIGPSQKLWYGTFTGTWSAAAIGESGGIGDYYPSLALNPAGQPRVTYFERVTGGTGPLMFTAPKPNASAFTIQKQQRLLVGSGSVEPYPNDQLTVQRQEQFVGLAPGQTQTVMLSCPGGYLVLDGSPLIQHVDQGAASRADIEVLQSQSTGLGGYTFTLHNPTAQSAQAKVFTTCVRQSSNDGGAITVSGPIVVTAPFSTGTTLRTLSCQAGSVAVDPGYRFTGGFGIVSRSQPSADLASWTFAIDSGGDGAADLSIRCLRPATSGGHLLVTQEVRRQVTVGAGQAVTEQLSCPVGYKGIVASFALPTGLRLLGDEPQPITRVFSLQNTTSGPLTGTIDLLCLMNTTGHSASVFTTSPFAATVGQTVEYRILITNTGQVPLTFGNFTDGLCDPGTISGGPTGPLPAGESTTYTCKHALTLEGTVRNTATITGTPSGGAAITHTSNSVVVNVSAPAFTALTIPPNQHGPQVLVGLTVTSGNSRVQVAVYGLAAQLSGKPASPAGKLVLIGRVIRGHANGRVRIAVVLNSQGHRALERRHNLNVTVVTRVTPPRGKTPPKQVTRMVTLRS
jgi:uncharacterized repeat protein (TIGR01451 family)